MHRFAIRLLASAAFAATLLLAADAQACRSYQGQRDLVTLASTSTSSRNSPA
jgi:hypothetical protein